MIALRVIWLGGRDSNLKEPYFPPLVDATTPAIPADFSVPFNAASSVVRRTVQRAITRAAIALALAIAFTCIVVGWTSAPCSEVITPDSAATAALNVSEPLGD